MNIRSSKLFRCIRCRMAVEICVCELFPCQKLRISLLVLIHEREYWKPSNTGHLLRLISPQAKVVVRRNPWNPEKTLSLLNKKRKQLVLFPSKEAKDLSLSYVESLKEPVQFIIPDGSWRQARKIIVRDPHLKNLPRVQLKGFPPSQYRLRKERRREGMATFEAIARVLGMFESRELQEKMELAFSCMTDRMLWMRGKIPREQGKVS